MTKRWILVPALAVAVLAGCALPDARQSGLERVEHIVVIYAENRSFDHFFMGAFGSSFLNHQWLICACTPVDPNAPASVTQPA